MIEVGKHEEFVTAQRQDFFGNKEIPKNTNVEMVKK